MARCKHCAKLKKINFLQDHYNQYRDKGGDHIMYSIYNDLPEEIAQELRRNYESTHPVGPTGNQKFQK